MATEIYIVSGFLGAGKTTLIQKLLKEAFQRDKVVLIENDFGEISVAEGTCFVRRGAGQAHVQLRLL
jgi:G3E family GTPase